MADRPTMPLHLRSDEDLGAALRAMPARSPGPRPSRWPAARTSPPCSRAHRPRGRGPGRRRRASRRTPPIDALALDAGAAGARLRDRGPARPRRGRRRRRTRAAGPPDHLGGPSPAPSPSASAVASAAAVRPGPAAPRQPDGPRRAGEPRCARRAARASTVRCPADPTIGPPDAAWVDPALNDQVALVWPSSDRLPATQEPGVGLVLTAFRGAVDDGWFTKASAPARPPNGSASGISPGIGCPATRTSSSTKVRTGRSRSRAVGSATSCSGQTADHVPARDVAGARRCDRHRRDPAVGRGRSVLRPVSGSGASVRGVGTGCPAPTENAHMSRSRLVLAIGSRRHRGRHRRFHRLRPGAARRQRRGADPPDGVQHARREQRTGRQHRGRHEREHGSARRPRMDPSPGPGRSRRERRRLPRPRAARRTCPPRAMRSAGPTRSPAPSRSSQRVRRRR